jgi:hypothetical protein
MTTESELKDLLRMIGDQAPTVDDTLNRLALPAVSAAPAPRSHRRWLPIGAVIAVVAASVTVSVVVRGDDPRRGAAGPAATSPTVDRESYPMPLDAYYASATQQRTLERAQFVLAQRCAQAHGVTVPTAVVPAGDPGPDFLMEIANDVRPVTVEQARTIGYELYPSGPGAFDAVVAGLTPPQLEIYQGWSSDLKLPKPTSRFLLAGGCYDQAAQTLLEGATPAPVPGQTTTNGLPTLYQDDATVNNMYLNAARTGETSPQAQQAQKRWATCMDAHGYPGLRTTDDAIQKIPDMRSASAKRQAVQDVNCKQSTGFMTVWIASMTKAQKAVIAAHRSQLAGFKDRLATRMANASKALQ